MRFAAVLNSEGGTLRTTDLDAFSKRMTETLEAAGHTVDIDVVAGKDVAAALDKAVARRSIDVVLAGGGDGTISAAAARLMGKKKALAILPAGTMNLVARGLGIPQSLNEAIAAFADGKIMEVDIASANGEPFVHQFSVGMHAKMIHLRDKMDFGSRLGKIRASARAAYATLANPPKMDVTLTIGEAEVIVRASAIGVTNNLFGEGHLPYADNPAGGVLGIYVTVARQKGELMKFMLNVARGKWRDNEHVEIHQTDKVNLKIRSRRGKLYAAMDGELVDLEPQTSIEIHPKALKVLVPARQ
ncbi:multidrug transporter [Mesorhizobium sp. Root157]|uniref:diacylglycerol/lipid kinase family protein n=1 Tax=Mesorhizobium sp. Root157 TaxID=1736477 RepID=UPI0006FD4AF8|nr:diacylglycerol kinase family protein [Mesorhizobium sp. Root157]KQZ80937.1 multidrug transporter [Mesorhizobium sp. Root157]